MRILVTGGCGFIGHHFVEHWLKNSDADIVVLDKLTYASNGFDRLRDIEAFDDKRVTVVTSDFSKPLTEGVIREIGKVDYIFHMGAETHVDKSIDDPEPFVIANVLGTMHMLNYARGMYGLKTFFYFSTDEVFGPALGEVRYSEWARYCSSNPYAATKAGGEELVLAYANTYGLKIVITHCMNVFGERQHPEKIIPMCIRKILLGETITIHANKTKTISGSRFWIHARNVAAAIEFLVNNGYWDNKFNIVGEREVSNLDMAKFIATVLGRKLDYVMVDFHSSRPGHDLRYALDGALMHRLGWRLPLSFEQSLEKTIHWYLDNTEWLETPETKEAIR